MKRILFVDDESHVLDGVRRAFRDERGRWDMHFATSAEDALLAFETCAFDVVVSDMRMPGMDGATFLGLVKDRYPSTARLVLSGYSDQLLALRALSVAHRCLAKPCNPEELREAINRVSVLQEILCSPQIQSVVGGVCELPSHSSTYNRLITAIQNPEISIADVALLLEKDIAMSAKVLQIANSAFFGLPRAVSSLRQAAMYLGLATIKNLVLASEAFRAYTPHASVPSSAYEFLQRHSYMTALIAGTLPVSDGMRDLTITAALLHDIGRLFLASAMPEAFCATLAQDSNSDLELFEIEEAFLGTSHAEIGAYLLGLWGIPFPAVEAIAHHHRPARLTHASTGSNPILDMTEAVYCADLLAHELELHPEDAQGQKMSARDRLYLEERSIFPLYPAFRERAIQAIARTSHP